MEISPLLIWQTIKDRARHDLLWPFTKNTDSGGKAGTRSVLLLLSLVDGCRVSWWDPPPAVVPHVPITSLPPRCGRTELRQGRTVGSCRATGPSDKCGKCRQGLCGKCGTSGLCVAGHPWCCFPSSQKRVAGSDRGWQVWAVPSCWLKVSSAGARSGRPAWTTAEVQACVLDPRKAKAV